LNRWEEYLCKLAPEDTKSIKKMCGEMKKSSVLQPYSNPPGLRKLGQTISSMLTMMPIMPLFMKYGRKSCDEYFKELGFKNKFLKDCLSNMYGFHDFSALAFIMILAWFNQKNAGYLKGGSLPLAKRMTDRFLDLGGKLTKGARVEKIIVVDNVAKGLILSDGTKIKADYVVSAADGYSTIFNMLEGKYLNEKISNAYKNWKLFPPLVQVSFGINKKIESEGPSEMWIVKDQSIGRTKLDNGYSFMNYSFDNTMAPEGKSVIVMRFDSQWELWKDIARADYQKEKEKIEEDARKLLEKRYPGISSFIEVCDVATPVTDVKYTGVWKGSYEGFMPSSKNLMDSLNPVLPGLNNFFMAGQWLSPGGGLPPAAQTGRWAIQLICKQERTHFKSNSRELKFPQVQTVV
jgi:phytoene dehydrogenase-like protein